MTLAVVLVLYYVLVVQFPLKHTIAWFWWYSSDKIVLYLWYQVSGANFCVALVIQLLLMHTIGDPRGGTVGQCSGTVHQHSGTVRGRSHRWSVRCQTRTQIISPSQFVAIKLEKNQAIHFSV